MRSIYGVQALRGPLSDQVCGRTYTGGMGQHVHLGDEANEILSNAPPPGINQDDPNAPAYSRTNTTDAPERPDKLAGGALDDRSPEKRKQCQSQPASMCFIQRMQHIQASRTPYNQPTPCGVRRSGVRTRIHSKVPSLSERGASQTE